MTVSAADDDDTANGEATFGHITASTDSAYSAYSFVINAVDVTEADDDEPGVIVAPPSLSVTEESTATYTVVLATLPTEPVTVSVAKQSGGDDDLTVSPADLTFTTDDWSTAQTVTVSAADDVDRTNGAATFTHSASGADFGSVVIDSVTATESDNDWPGVIVNPEELSVAEESTASYTVVLNTQPTAPVTVAVAKQSGGDAHLTVAPALLTFTTTDWSTAQAVTVSAADDPDTDNGTATIEHTATSTDSEYNAIAIASVAAREVENDMARITLTGTGQVERVQFDWTVVGVYTQFEFQWNETGGAISDTSHGLDGAGAARSYGFSSIILGIPERRFGHPFRFRVRGQLTNGNWISSNDVAVEALPPKPGGLSATTAGADAVRLSWNAVTGPVASYEYRYRLSSAGEEDWGDWTDTSSSTASHTVTGLDNDTSYTFQVRVAAGTVRSAASDAATGIAIGPGAKVTPTTLEVNENGSATYTVVLGHRAVGAGDGSGERERDREQRCDGEPGGVDLHHGELEHRSNGERDGGR